MLLFRRLPVIFALRWNIWQIESTQATLFTGFFGPIGVSAVFYLYLGLEFLKHVTVDGKVREDALELADKFSVIVWFLAICSIVVHGLSVPVGKLGWYLPRTISSARVSQATSTEQDAAFQMREIAPTPTTVVIRRGCHDEEGLAGIPDITGTGQDSSHYQSESPSAQYSEGPQRRSNET